MLCLLCEKMYKKLEFDFIGVFLKRRSQVIIPSRSSVGGNKTDSGRQGAAKQKQNEQADNKKSGDFSHFVITILINDTKL